MFSIYFFIRNETLLVLRNETRFGAMIRIEFWDATNEFTIFTYKYGSWYAIDIT